VSVSFVYPGSKQPSLIDLNLDFQAHKLVSIVGSSGSGKSTLLSLLCSLYEPSSGCIYVDGRPLSSLKLPWQRSIGLVSQDTFLFNDSILSNLTYGLEAIDYDSVLYACDMASIHEFISNLPDGYSTIIGPDGIQLSGGQRQRLSLARALVHQPSLLILDEATSALDPENISFVAGLLLTLRDQMTVVAVTHNLATAAQSDLIYVLENGQLSSVGTHNCLLSSHDEPYTRLWNAHLAAGAKTWQSSANSPLRSNS